MLHRAARGLRAAFLLGLALLVALLVAASLVPLPARLAAPSSRVIEMRDGQPAYVFLSPDDKWRLAAKLERIDPAFVAALIALEDARFHAHPGVDPLALVRAAWSNLSHGRRVSGASTITMQLARLLEPRPRTVGSKLVEAFRAVQLETRLSKRQILEAYLSFAPYGENLEGVEAAALAYFGHSAAHLTPVEIATLLAVPQGPARLYPKPDNVARLAARRDAILGRIFPGVIASATGAAPPDHLSPFPRLSPHAAEWLARRYPDRARIRSTLDGGAQRVVEGIAARATADLARRGIDAGAIVVVDHHTRETVALIGNLTWDRDGGQIAMFDRPRSPGSTLKPLLYALAVDRGLALPSHLVADIPVAYGAWRPRNFDGAHAGLVTLREALVRSLNLPFVALLGRFGVEPFLGELARLGVTSPRTAPGHYGLSLIVGGIEVTPLEIAGIYAALAEDGHHRPLRFTASDPAGSELSVFGPGAAYLTREALAVRDRPDFPRRRALRGLPPEIHWKTGTSFGFRDAWAVGSGPRYTAVVWLGNVDRRASAELIGAEAAGPILFDVLEALADPLRAPHPQSPPDDLAPVEVCAFSGYLPTPACTERTTVLAPRSAVAPAPCPYHLTLDVDSATGEALTPLCRAGRSSEQKSFLVLPSSVAGWLDEQHRSLGAPPPYAAGCEPPSPERPPRILSPADGQVLLLVPGLSAAEQELPLLADTSAAEVSWFVDGALVRTAPASQQVFIAPTPGAHEIVVVDAGGRKDRIAVEVRASR